MYILTSLDFFPDPFGDGGSSRPKRRLCCRCLCCPLRERELWLQCRPLPRCDLREWRRPRCSCHPWRDRWPREVLDEAELGRDAPLSSELGRDGEVDRESASLVLEGDDGYCERDLVRWVRQRCGRRPCV